MATPVRSIVFDFDGVLADSEDAHRRAFDAILREEGLALSNEDYFRHYLGLPDEACLRRALEANGRRVDAQDLAAFVARKRAAYARLLPQVSLYPGVAPLLQALARERPLAVASGAFRDEIEAILRAAGALELFAAVVSAEDVGRGKPAPDPFLRALAELNRRGGTELAAAECLVVEDAPHGIEAALAAGMRCFAVATNHPPAALARAEIVLESVLELGRRPELLA